MNEDLSHLVEKPQIKIAKMESIEKDSPDTLLDADESTEILVADDATAPAPLMTAPLQAPHFQAPHLRNAITVDEKVIAPQPQKWNQNKKIPKIYPGIIISLLTEILLGIGVVYQNWVVGGIGLSIILLGALYWTFCVFRITGQLQYKSAGAKILDRTLALIIPLVVNPLVLFTLIGFMMAMSAMVIAFFFHPWQVYLANHAGAPAHISVIVFCLSSIVVTLLPLVTIPAICVGWTYKFMVKVALVNEPIEKQSFRRTRTPAIIVAGTMLSCLLIDIGTFLSVGGSLASNVTVILIAIGMIVLIFGSSLCQALSFYILWKCVKNKEALSIIAVNPKH